MKGTRFSLFAAVIVATIATLALASSQPQVPKIDARKRLADARIAPVASHLPKFPDTSTKPRVANLPALSALRFEPNRGQTGPHVKFLRPRFRVHPLPYRDGSGIRDPETPKATDCVPPREERAARAVCGSGLR